MISQGKEILPSLGKTKTLRVIHLTTLRQNLGGLLINGNELTMAVQQKIKARLDMSVIIQGPGTVWDQLRNPKSIELTSQGEER